MTDEEYKDELSMLRYFWREKGDLRGYSGFEAMKPELEKRNPEILMAWNQFVIAEKMLDNLLNY